MGYHQNELIEYWSCCFHAGWYSVLRKYVWVVNFMTVGDSWQCGNGWCSRGNSSIRVFWYITKWMGSTSTRDSEISWRLARTLEGKLKVFLFPFCIFCGFFFFAVMLSLSLPFVCCFSFFISSFFFFQQFNSFRFLF